MDLRWWITPRTAALLALLVGLAGAVISFSAGGRTVTLLSHEMALFVAGWALGFAAAAAVGVHRP